jgi:molybdopterin molybdotransferase
VAYFSTGDEILSLGEPPREGAVYDSNRYTVFGLLTRLGCEVIDLGVVRDEPALLEAAFTRAAQQADAIITSGGVSVGEADFTKYHDEAAGRRRVLAHRHAPGPSHGRGTHFRQDFNKLASALMQKWRKQLSKSNLPPASAILFGLPGNPVAVMVTFLAFVRPALLRMMGAPEPIAGTAARAKQPRPSARSPAAPSTSAASSAPQPTARCKCCTTGNQGSGVLSSMVQANGLIVLHHAPGRRGRGRRRGSDVMMFDGVM